jgi:hypothetical protein
MKRWGKGIIRRAREREGEEGVRGERGRLHRVGIDDVWRRNL